MPRSSDDEGPSPFLSRLVDNAVSHAMIGLDRAGTITFWSRGAEALFGWSAAEAVGQPGAMIFTPEDLAADVPADELAKASRDGHAEDVRWHMRQDGSRFWGNGAMNPLADRSGFVKVVRDSTAQHRTEQALKASEQRQRDILESATEYAIFTTVSTRSSPAGTSARSACSAMPRRTRSAATAA